jgi:D-amino-acid dehydrogenase
MARVEAMVLGAGIVGTSIALHLVKRGLTVALIDRREPGEETSYGNLGVIGGAGVYPTAFPRRLSRLIRIALNRAPEANYYPSFLPSIARWLISYFTHSSVQSLEETARVMRPLLARSVAEHEALMREAGALRYLRKDGWISLFRTRAAFDALKPELELGAELGAQARLLDVEGTLALEPNLAPAFRHAIHWPDIASVSNPLAVTQAYARRFAELGGMNLRGDARSLRRIGADWAVSTNDDTVQAEDVIVALGPWAPDVLEPLGVRLPLAVKRGYHLHFYARGNASLRRPVVDIENGYGVSPMEQGLRLTTGAEFAPRDAPPSPAQFARIMPYARELFPLGDPIEAQPWLGSRPVFADSRPVIGRAPGKPGLWLAYGHGHLGFTLGPVTGRLLAEMMTGAQTFCDPIPYGAQRFLP